MNSTISNKFVLLLVFLGSICSQSENRDYDEELRYQNQAINDLKKEINSLRLKIKKAESKENSAKNRISSIDQELALTNKLIQSLKREEAKTRNTIASLKDNIAFNENELENLKARYETRIKNSYLNGRITDLERVLSSTTWRQAVYRAQYLKIISEIEKKITKKIEKLLIEISQQKIELEAP